MKEKIKNILIPLIIIVIVIGVGYLGYQYYKKITSEEGSEIQEKESQREVITRKLAEKYNALIDWNENIYYTIQLQDSLVNSDRPIVFTGYVDDVFIKDEQYYIRFVTDFFTTPEIRFVLKCDYEKIAEILNKLENNSETHTLMLKLFGDYVVVARIDDVKKITLQITGYPESEEEVVLEYTPGDTFIATGNCIDFSYIEKD